MLPFFKGTNADIWHFRPQSYVAKKPHKYQITLYPKSFANTDYFCVFAFNGLLLLSLLIFIMKQSSEATIERLPIKMRYFGRL